MFFQYYFYPFQNSLFCQIYKKQHVFFIFIDIWPLPYQWYTVIFSLLTMRNSHYSEGALSQNALVNKKFKKFKWQKHPRFLSNFPFVNLQLKSMVETLRHIKSSTH